MLVVETNFDQYIKYLDDITKDIEKEIEIGSRKLGLIIKRQIQIEWPDDTGQSRNQITFQEDKDGVTVFARAEYSRYIDNIDPSVEFVRRPGGKLPPLSVIEDWARRKGILVGGDNTDEMSIVFLIARKIARDGVKNMKIFYRAREDNSSYIEKTIYPKIIEKLKQ